MLGGGGAGGPAEGRSSCRQLCVLRPASRTSVQTAGGELEQRHEQRLRRAGQNRSVQRRHHISTDGYTGFCLILSIIFFFIFILFAVVLLSSPTSCFILFIFSLCLFYLFFHHSSSPFAFPSSFFYIYILLFSSYSLPSFFIVIFTPYLSSFFSVPQCRLQFRLFRFRVQDGRTD